MDLLTDHSSSPEDPHLPEWMTCLSEQNWIDGNQAGAVACVEAVAFRQKPIGMFTGLDGVARAHELRLHVIQHDLEFPQNATVYKEPQRLIGELFPDEAIEYAGGVYDLVLPGIAQKMRTAYSYYKHHPLIEAWDHLPYTDEGWAEVSLDEYLAYEAINGLLLGYPIDGSAYSTLEYIKRRLQRAKGQE